MAPRLIFCADGNPAHAVAAHEAGWLYGARLPARGLAPLPLHMADQDWRRPDRARYMACLARHRPALATVLDWEEPEQLPEVLAWAEEAAQHVGEAVLIVPKVPGQVGRLPRHIGGRPVWLAYSVPTSHGGSPLFLDELRGWPVHLLGGSPQKQYNLWRYLRAIAEVRSADGNMLKKQAGKGLFWTQKRVNGSPWVSLKTADGQRHEGNGPLECVRRSCGNIAAAWRRWSGDER